MRDKDTLKYLALLDKRLQLDKGSSYRLYQLLDDLQALDIKEELDDLFQNKSSVFDSPLNNLIEQLALKYPPREKA